MATRYDWSKEPETNEDYKNMALDQLDGLEYQLNRQMSPYKYASLTEDQQEELARNGELDGQDWSWPCEMMSNVEIIKKALNAMK